MQVRIGILEQSAAEFIDEGEQLKRRSNELYEIIVKYRDLTCFHKRISQINKVRDRIWEQARSCDQFGQALSGILSTYSEYENKIIEQCEGVSDLIMEKEAGMQENVVSHILSQGGGGRIPVESTPYDLSDDFLEAFRALAGIKSDAGDLEDLTDLYELFTDSDFLEGLGEFAGEIKDLDILKTLGYMVDSFDLVDSINTLDFDTLEGLLEKYIKKGVKAVTGIKGTTGGIYLDLYWNVGENLVEGLQSWIDSPSLGTAAGAVFHTVCGSFWETGTDLGGDALDVIYKIFGQEFDRDNYDTAMNWLKDTITSPETYKSIWNAGTDIGGNALDVIYGVFGQEFDHADYDTAMNWLGGTLENAIDSTISVVEDVVNTTSEAIWDGACAVVDTVASWFKW